MCHRGVRIFAVAEVKHDIIIVWHVTSPALPVSLCSVFKSSQRLRKLHIGFHGVTKQYGKYGASMPQSSASRPGKK
jgi:hypothetical protein